MTKDKTVLYKQLENNLILGFQSDFAKRVAIRFYIDGFSEQEMVDVFKEFKYIKQADRIKVQNYFRDIKNGTMEVTEQENWDSEQLYALKMLK